MFVIFSTMLLILNAILVIIPQDGRVEILFLVDYHPILEVRVNVSHRTSKGWDDSLKTNECAFI